MHVGIGINSKSNGMAHSHTVINTCFSVEDGQRGSITVTTQNTFTPLLPMRLYSLHSTFTGEGNENACVLWGAPVQLSVLCLPGHLPEILHLALQLGRPAPT